MNGGHLFGLRRDMFKKMLDLSIALTALLVFLPILAASALAITLTSPGPILFRQKRLGKHGVVFEILKFRSMVDNTEETGTGLYSYEGDQRITRVGHFLRKTSLDELPQLFNVIGGSMSLVGPRPPVTYELGPWEEYTDDMRRRFDVKPGITGLAQVSGRNELDWDTKIMLDNRYVALYQKYGVLIDLKILLHTIWVVLAGRNTIETLPSGQEGPIARRARKVLENR